MGTYAITGAVANGTGLLSNYSVNLTNGTLTVNKAGLTITADDQGMTYGGTLPALTATYTGLVNGDTPASLTTRLRSPRRPPAAMPAPTRSPPAGQSIRTTPSATSRAR